MSKGQIKLLNAYDLPQAELERIQVWVDPEDKRLLNSVLPMRGLETYLFSNLLKQICKELRDSKTTSYTPDNARRLHLLIAGHLSPVSLTGKRHKPDVKG